MVARCGFSNMGRYLCYWQGTPHNPHCLTKSLTNSAARQLLHLHPLTLEDILTQDPREKLEMFPKLGYYFVSFRAIESRKTRDRLRHILSEDTIDAIDEGIVGEVNVYLVIFKEGICSVRSV